MARTERKARLEVENLEPRELMSANPVSSLLNLPKPNAAQHRHAEPRMLIDQGTVTTMSPAQAVKATVPAIPASVTPVLENRILTILGTDNADSISLTTSGDKTWINSQW